MMKKLSVLFFLLLLVITPGFGQQKQDSAKVIRYDLSSPYHAVRTHLEYLQKDNFYPKVSMMALDGKGLSQAERIELAIQLKEIYDGMGKYIRIEGIPKEPNYMDSLGNKKRYVVVKELPDIYVEKIGSRWVYSSESVARIPEIHRKVYPFGNTLIMDLARYLNKGTGGQIIFGLMLWQYLAILFLIVLTFIGYKTLSWLLHLLFRELLKRFRAIEKLPSHALTVSKAVSSMMIGSFLFSILPLLQIPPQYAQYLFLAFQILLPIFGIVVLTRLVDLFSTYLAYMASKTTSSLDDQLIPILRKTLRVFVVFAGVLFILKNLDFNVTGIIAGVSIGGLAFALAAQDTIKNLFGSLMIFVDRPFQVGDWIKTNDLDGTVEEVGFRSTRVRTHHNSIVSIPNGNIANMTIDNMGLRNFRQFRTMLSITYDTPPEVIELFVEGLRQIVRNHPEVWQENPQVYLNAFGASSLDIIFNVFLAVPDRPNELRVRHEIILEILHLAGKMGVRFAFPTQTLHVEEFPGKGSLTPTYTETPEQMRAKITGGYTRVSKKD